MKTSMQRAIMGWSPSTKPKFSCTIRLLHSWVTKAHKWRLHIDIGQGSVLWRTVGGQCNGMSRLLIKVSGLQSTWGYQFRFSFCAAMEKFLSGPPLGATLPQTATRLSDLAGGVYGPGARGQALHLPE
jgi:hypothetical protein